MHLDTVAFPGTPIRLPQPHGFERPEGFPGFTHPASEASITVQTLPAPFAQLVADFDRERLLKQGLYWQGDEPVVLGDRLGQLVHVAQSAGGQSYEKWILLIDGEHETGLIMATYRVDRGPDLKQFLREAVLAAQWSDEVAPVKPPFHVAESPLLQYATTWTEMAIYTPDGRFVPGEPGEALFIAGFGFAPIRGEQAQRSFCTQRIGALDDDLMGASITTLRDTTVGGLAGFEAQAVGTSRTHGRRRAIYQIELFMKERYVIMAGVADEAVAAQYVPAFQTMAAGFQLDA